MAVPLLQILHASLPLAGYLCGISSRDVRSYCPPSAVIIPERGQPSPSVEISINLALFSSIFHAAFADRVAFPCSLFRMATIVPGILVPLFWHSPINSGDVFECSGTFRTSRTTEWPSSSNIYSSPQIFHDEANKGGLSEMSVPPKSLSPRSLCLFSITTTLSLRMKRPISALGTSAPHRIPLNPS